MKNHFLIPYHGNKRNEVERIYNLIESKINDIDIIVEPFCGSSAFSYYVWLKNKDKNLSYILNDNNNYINELYNLCKDNNKVIDIYNKLVILKETTTNKEKYLEICKNAKEGDLVSYIFINKIYTIRPGLYPSTKAISDKILDTFKNAPILEFLQTANIKICNKDGIEIYNEYRDNPKAVIFLDPPYIQSCNSFYNNPTTNIYEYLYNNDIEKEKAKIILCLENIWIIKLLFKDKKSIVYDKNYQMTKKKTEHIIIYKI